MDKELDGQALDTGAMLALLEILNNGPDVGRLPLDKRPRITNPTGKGHILVFSTVEDMDCNKDMSDLWNKGPWETKHFKSKP